MSARPLLGEMLDVSGVASTRAPLRAATPSDGPEASLDIPAGAVRRRLSIYAPRNAFALLDELDFLTHRAIDRNIFFAPQFLLPAMPRLDDRRVKLMVVRDGAGHRSRLRFLMPYSVERVGLIGGPAVIRSWTHPFGPLGTPLLDGEGCRATIASILSALRRPELGLPDLLVLPDVRLDEPFAAALTATLQSLGLPMALANPTDRAALLRREDRAGFHVDDVLSPKRRRELQRQRRLLDARGAVSFDVAREPAAVRRAVEEFLILEASGWKGRARSALVTDRYRAAFAREAINQLAERDRARVYSLRVDGRAIASLVAFVDGPEAFAWKTAFDEAYASASPGFQVAALASEALLAEPGIRRADSCTVPDHFLMNRLWKDRIRIGTFVVGLDPWSGSRVEAAARGLDHVRRSRNAARLVRRRLKDIVGRG